MTKDANFKRIVKFMESAGMTIQESYVSAIKYFRNRIQIFDLRRTVFGSNTGSDQKKYREIFSKAFWMRLQIGTTTDKKQWIRIRNFEEKKTY